MDRRTQAAEGPIKSSLKFEMKAESMSCGVRIILVSLFLAGCDSGSGNSLRSGSSSLVQDTVRDSTNSCIVELNDGTILELFRSQATGQQAGHLNITAKHRIDNHHLTGEPLDVRQSPVKSLSFAIGAKPAVDADWVAFPSARERGELSFCMFYFNAAVKADRLDVPIHFRVTTRDETYVVSGPDLSELADSPVAFEKYEGL